ncbi:class I SAM-dependent methyltransferase [Ilumatobacter nonamiensis]|uniref:class I SAM-dependent methyltransferase n=1 Tax=Ilumatobacter nonamiensis TaxID=467093 RepID=UPI00034AF3E9|nr:class I SAM-dependent methyltransferase [Ilumatobacter nonamiensis]
MSVPAESIFFDLWSSTYDRPGLQQATYRPIHNAVLGRLEGLEPKRILDLGCGTGHLAERLSMMFPKASVVGADLSDGMIERAAERLTDDDMSDFVRADAQHLPLRDHSFDVVTCTESFHWYADQEAAAAELARLIAPGGRVVIASIATVTGFADDAIQRATALAGRPVRAIPKRELRRLLEAAGFEVEHQGRIPRLGFVPWPMLTDATRR